LTKSWQPHARHILDAVTKIRRIQARGNLTKDDILYDAALRNLQTLSESTQYIPELLKLAHPNIPWRDVSGFRNILVHSYLGEIDAQTITAVIEEHLDPL
jgi:uncharacterized protein with HEPN domain